MPDAETIEQLKANQKVQDLVALHNVRDELKRAREKFPGTSHVGMALVEEVGELHQALLELQYEPHKGVSCVDVYWEAIQVASTALRIATEGDATIPAYVPPHLTCNDVSDATT